MTTPKPPSHIPNVGFLLFDGEKARYFRLFSYGRYLNQRNLNESYLDAFGNTHSVQRRQDIQLQKFLAPVRRLRRPVGSARCENWGS